MMYALARFSLSDDPADECDGEEADAISAYTQAPLGGPETWITIPYEYWPASWRNKGYVRPMVRLLANLYGHPLAGLYWERHCHKALTKIGFQLVQGWECLYVHDEAKLFLSVYVDDFKMAGIKRNLAPMWARLRDELDLDPSVPLDNSTYLGCRQNNVQVNSAIQRSIDVQRDFHAQCMKRRSCC